MTSVELRESNHCDQTWQKGEKLVKWCKYIKK